MSATWELTDESWAKIKPLLPASGSRGGRWSDHRRVINAILWRERAPEERWRNIPTLYGPWQTAYARRRRWGEPGGLWERVLPLVVVIDEHRQVKPWSSLSDRPREWRSVKR